MWIVSEERPHVLKTRNGFAGGKKSPKEGFCQLDLKSKFFVHGMKSMHYYPTSGEKSPSELRIALQEPIPVQGSNFGEVFSMITVTSSYLPF